MNNDMIIFQKCFRLAFHYIRRIMTKHVTTLRCSSPHHSAKAT